MAYSREHMIEWLAQSAAHTKRITDQLVTEIKLGTANEWTAYELMRAAERELQMASAYLSQPEGSYLGDPEDLAPMGPSRFTDGDPEPDEDREMSDLEAETRAEMRIQEGDH